MRTILYFLRKEFLQLIRDRKLLPILFLSPLLQLLVLSYAANLDIDNIHLVVCDMDKTSISRDFANHITSSSYFTIVNNIDNINEINDYLDSGKVPLALTIPKNFGNKIIKHETATIQVIIDGSNANSANIDLSYFDGIVKKYAINIMLKEKRHYPELGQNQTTLKPEPRIWYNPDLKSRNFVVPGILALVLMILTMLLTSLAIVKEKEIGTLEQLNVTPIKPWQLIISKLLPFAIVGIIDTILILIVTTQWFEVHIQGSISLLMIMVMIYLISTLGLGLFVSTISNTQQQAMLTSTFFIIMPMIYLSGFIFPIDNMPTIIQYITYIMPLRYFFVILRGIFLKGSTIFDIWPQATALLAFGIFILSLSVMRFKKTSS